MNNSNHVKDINMAAVLRCIHQMGPISKGNIATRLGVSSVTAHKLVEELCALGLCVESGDYVSYGGKKAALYTLNSDYGLILGLTLSRSGITARLSNLFLETVVSKQISIDPQNVEQTVAALISVSHELVSMAGKRRVIAVGLSVPGSASRYGEQIDLPDYPQWNSISLGTLISKELGLPVFADNDVNALALSAKWLGPAAGYRDFVCVQIENGVGVGAVIGNELLCGATYHAAELGHITLDPKGKLCRCGRRGCLQTHLDELAVLKEFDPELSVDRALEMLKNGEKKITRAFDDYLCYVRVAIENVLQVFDPEAVFLSCPVAQAVPGFSGSLQTPYFEIPSLGSRRRPPIQMICESAIFEAAAGAVAFDQLIKNPLTWIG